MQRMLLISSLILGLALVGADWVMEGGHASALSSYEGGTPSENPEIWEDGTPIPTPK